MDENKDDRVCLSVRKDLYDKVLSGEVKVIHKEASDYWRRVFLQGKGLNAKAYRIESGRTKTRKSFLIEAKAVNVDVFNGEAYFALTLGKILYNNPVKLKKKTVKKTITKPIHGQKWTLRIYTIQVRKCIKDIIKDVDKLKINGQRKEEIDAQKKIIVEKYCNQYKLNYSNINQIYYNHGNNQK